MEVRLDKRYPIAAPAEQCWAVLRDIRAVAACMPGAQVTEEVDATHYKGTVRSKVGPALMSFSGDIEVQQIDAAARALRLLAKGSDKSGSSASMQLTARLEDSTDAGQTLLVGEATIVVSGKLAQFGSRLLVPVSDAMLGQFAEHFGSAAAATPQAAAAAEGASAAAPAATAPAPAQARELNALALMWTVFKAWLARLFGRRT